VRNLLRKGTSNVLGKGKRERLPPQGKKIDSPLLDLEKPCCPEDKGKRKKGIGRD